MSFDMGFWIWMRWSKGISGRADGVHVILTGRDAHPKLVDLADTVTEMVEIKHHFRAGVKSVRGIEF
ncbi:cob(I)yrinic acid a,c-diamide adenosyltransferase [Candidatus Poribacteria bacterium]|nr:cob(I)yrinic acid a,c-diamide adenosyltransferase [Candidatus Poribacteria bacterium]